MSTQIRERERERRIMSTQVRQRESQYMRSNIIVPVIMTALLTLVYPLFFETLCCE